MRRCYIQYNHNAILKVINVKQLVIRTVNVMLFLASDREPVRNKKMKPGNQN